MSYISITQAGSDHTEWLKNLDFYKEEVDILRNRLAEIANKNTSFEARQGIEHFENQFIVQRNNIDELNHAIKEYASKMGHESLQHAGHIEKKLNGEHNSLKDQYETFEKTFNELRREFNQYLSKWM